MNCPYCETKQYESASSRFRNGGLALLPLVLILPINVLFDFSVGTTIIIGIIITLAILGLYPFVLNLSNEEEAFW
ncbi:CXXC-20-CXXC protein [Alkalibacillus almallahensis]|nr:CXXC-20-CXXC protein [Alkalibacillus almallahensis]